MKKILSTLLLFFAVIGVHAADLYLYFDNGDGNKWRALQMSQNGNNYSCEVSVEANNEFCFRFGKNSTDYDKWTNRLTLFAPGSDTGIDVPYTSGTIYHDSGAKCWKHSESAATTYSITATYNGNNELQFTISKTEASTTLYLAYDNGDGGDWRAVEMTKSGDTFTFDVESEANKQLSFRFQKNNPTHLETTWGDKRDNNLFAPENNTTVSLDGSTTVTAGQGAQCWQHTETEATTYRVTVTSFNGTNLTFTISKAKTSKEIFMVYRNLENGNTTYRIAEATTTTEATRGGRQVTLYSFNVPVYNNDQLRWKFLSNKNGNYNTKNDELFAPTDNRIPRNIPVNANEGAAYWYILPNFDGMATVSAWYTNDDQTRLNLEYKVTYYERPRKGNFFYSTDGGDTWLMVPNRAIVEGEYTQWNVSIAGTAGMEVRFRLDGLDGAQYFINETKELSDANYLFADFKTTQSGVFKFKDNSTYQFLIRKFDDVEVDKNQTISYEYEIAARKVNKDNNFTEFAFTVNANHHESYTMTPVTVDLENMKAAASFTALMSYDQDTGTMTLNPDTAGQTTEIHWVKYEHPFWEARSASSMEYADAKGNKQDVAVALWWSDTYLHPNDPRVKAWFPEKVDELANRKSVDKITDPSFKPQTSGGCLTYYRAYVTMKKVYVELPSNGPQRAVVNSQFAGNYGTRVAYAAELPQESTADIVSGVEEVAVDSEAAFDGEAEYFTISGIRVYGDPAPGLYIVRRGNKVTKEIVK